MDKFEALNRQTRDYKNNHCDLTSNLKTTGKELLTRKNAETFKFNNGQYPYRPY